MPPNRSISLSRQPTGEMLETLESRRLMSATVVGGITIHSVPTSTPVAATRTHVTKPHAPHQKVHHPAPKPRKCAASKAPRVMKAHASGSGTTNTPPVAGNWQTTYDDEFNGTTLNPVWHTAQVWDHAATVVGQGELEAYDASGVSVSNGQLHLTARKDNQYGVPYVSGLVTTGGDQTNPAQPKFSFRYGYMEVRAKSRQARVFGPRSGWWLTSGAMARSI